MSDAPRREPLVHLHRSDVVRRSVGSPALFAIIYGFVASSVYFSLTIVTDHALGLTPVVLLVAALFFLLTVMTYVEGASLHQERGGATVFARHAFNELVSFVAGWVILLDYVILLAIAALVTTHYLAEFWSPLRSGAVELVVALVLIALVASWNVTGQSSQRLARLATAALVDIGVQLAVVVIGVATFFSLDTITDPIELGSAPSWRNAIYGLTIAAVAFAGVESASGLAGEVGVSRRGLKRLIGATTGTATLLYVGLGTVAVTAAPIRDGHSPLTRGDEQAPLLALVHLFRPHWLAGLLAVIVAVTASIMLLAVANGATLGLSRSGYLLATNRQIPSLVGRLHPTRATPYVMIAIGALLAGALVIPRDLDFLVGIYAFGTMLSLTIAHVSVCVLRYREPARDRPYRIPLSLRLWGGDLPLPAVLGAVLGLLGWISVLAFHGAAPLVGGAWLAFGLILYVAYRTTEDKPLLGRVTVPESALRRETAGVDYRSILVPLLGTSLDDDIIQTAGRLAAESADADEPLSAVTIEALWIFEIPMSLPIDARLPEARLLAARRALARAKAVGEEYAGVEVATATVRARRTGQAIVEQARRLGVEAIVLGAEEPSRVRGGALLGGGPLENFVGDVTRDVVTKAPCRVILTAPPAASTAGQHSGPERLKSIS